VKPKGREKLDPKFRARLYLSSLMSGGTSEGALSNASSLRSLMEDHPEVQFLTADERLQVSQFLSQAGKGTPEKAKTFDDLADFFRIWTGKPEAKGPGAVEPEAQGPEPKAEPGAVPAPSDESATTAETAPVPPTAPTPPQPPEVSEESGGSTAEAGTPVQGETPGPPGSLVIESGVEPEMEDRFSVSPPAPPQPEEAPLLSGESPAPGPDSGAVPQETNLSLGMGLGNGGEEEGAPVVEDTLGEVKKRYYSMYTDFADKVRESALSQDLVENRKALTLGMKLEILLQEKQVGLPMEDAVKLRNAFSALRKSLPEKGEDALALEAMRLAAAFGDEEAAKAYAVAGGPPGTPAHETAPSAQPAASPPAETTGKGRPYDLPIDEITGLISKEDVGKEDLERTLGPASKLEAMIREGSAVPLKVLKDIVARASELGDRFSGEGKWDEAMLSYKLGLFFSRDRQGSYEGAAARAGEARTKKLFADLSRSEVQREPSPPPGAPPEPKPAPAEEAEAGPRIIQGSAEAFSYLLQSGPGFEAPDRGTGDSGPGIKPQYTEKYLMDPLHAYAILVAQEVPSAETVLKIIELHKATDQYTVDLAMKHAVMQNPEMQARIERILKK